VFQFLGYLNDSLKLIARYLPASNFIRRDLTLLGEDTGGELFGRHFKGEKSNYPFRTLGVLAVVEALGYLVSDVGSERRFAHGRATRKDN
jgi:hypothetical protein